MSDIRAKGLSYLNRILPDLRPSSVHVSKLYTADESWTGSPAWWFDLSIEKVRADPTGTTCLLGEIADSDDFVIFEVPNSFLAENLEGFETRYQDRIRLHIAAEAPDRFTDQRGPRKIDFSSFVKD